MQRTGSGPSLCYFFFRLPITIFALAAATASPMVRAASLRSETVEAWDEYLRTANARIQPSSHPEGSFLWVDESADRLSKVHKGEIVVSPAGPRIPLQVPSGLIHDWIGAAFLPNVTISDVLPVLRDYDHYQVFLPSQRHLVTGAIPRGSRGPLFDDVDEQIALL